MRLVLTGLGADGRSRVERVVEVDPEPAPTQGFVSVSLWDGPADPLPGWAKDPSVRLHDPGLRGGATWRAARYRPFGSTDMHRTDTTDYDVILAGSVTLELESGAVELAVGDMVVMTGVAHRWRAGAEGCVLSALMVPVPAST